MYVTYVHVHMKICNMCMYTYMTHKSPTPLRHMCRIQLKPLSGNQWVSTTWFPQFHCRQSKHDLYNSLSKIKFTHSSVYEVATISRLL